MMGHETDPKLKARSLNLCEGRTLGMLIPREHSTSARLWMAQKRPGTHQTCVTSCDYPKGMGTVPTRPASKAV